MCIKYIMDAFVVLLWIVIIIVAHLIIDKVTDIKLLNDRLININVKKSPYIFTENEKTTYDDLVEYIGKIYSSPDWERGVVTHDNYGDKESASIIGQNQNEAELISKIKGMQGFDSSYKYNVCEDISLEKARQNMCPKSEPPELYSVGANGKTIVPQMWGFEKQNNGEIQPYDAGGIFDGSDISAFAAI